MDLAIAQSEVWSQLNAQRITESKREKKRLQFLADLWSLSEFRTQRKTNPKSEMTHLELLNVLDFLNEQTNINFLYRNAQLPQQ